MIERRNRAWDEAIEAKRRLDEFREANANKEETLRIRSLSDADLVRERQAIIVWPMINTSAHLYVEEMARRLADKEPIQ